MVGHWVTDAQRLHCLFAVQSHEMHAMRKFFVSSPFRVLLFLFKLLRVVVRGEVERLHMNDSTQRLFTQHYRLPDERHSSDVLSSTATLGNESKQLAFPKQTTRIYQPFCRESFGRESIILRPNDNKSTLAVWLNGFRQNISHCISPLTASAFRNRNWHFLTWSACVTATRKGNSRNPINFQANDQLPGQMSGN